MRRRLLQTMLALAVAAGAPMVTLPAESHADGWSLIKKDDEKPKPKKKKKKAKKKKAELGPKSALDPALAHLAEYVEMLLVDPSDDWLLTHFVEESEERPDGPLGALETIAEALPAVAGHGSLPVVRARVLAATGDTEGALDLLESELAAHPGEPAVAYFLARALREQGRDERAMDLLEQALGWVASSKQPSFLADRIVSEIVETAIALSDLETAAERFVDLCERTGELSAHFEQILDMFALEEDPGGAIAFTRDVLEARSWPAYERFFLELTLAEELSDEGRDDEATAHVVKAVKLFAGSEGECAALTELAFEVAGQEDALDLIRHGASDACFWIEAASRLEGAGKVEQALDLLDEAAKKHGGGHGLLMARVDTLMRAGEVEEAVTLLRKEAKDEDADPLVVVKLAEVLFETGSRQEAIEVLEKLGDESDSPAVHWVLEQFYDSVNEPLLAKEQNEILVELAPGDPEHVIRLGERLYSEGRIDEAVELWETIPALYEDEADGYLRLADVLLDHMRYKKAEEMYLEALEASDGVTEVEAMRKLALYYDVVNRLEDAESWWTEVLQAPAAAFGTRREASIRLVQLWSRKHTLKVNVGTVEKMYDEEPERIELGLLLAEVYLELGRQEDCRTLLTELLARIADSVSTAPPAEKVDLMEAADHVIVTLDRLNRLQKLWAEAMEAFDEAAAIFPGKLPELELKTAEYAVLAGDHAAAREAVERALEAAPGDPEVNGEAADLLFRIGDIARGAECLKAIAAKDPARYEVRLQLARALVHLDRPDEAAERLVALVADCPYAYLAGEALSLLVAVAGSHDVGLDLERWMYKLYTSDGERPYVARRLVALYTERLAAPAGPPPAVFEVDAGGPAAGAEPSGEPWRVRAAKVAARVIVEGPEEAKLGAVRVLARMREPAVAENLLKRALYLKSPADQVMALVAVSGSLEASHGELVLPYLATSREDVKAAAVLCLAFTGDAAYLEELERHYFDGFQQVRAAAVLGTGLLMARTGVGVDEGATKKIRMLLRTRQWKVTYQATALTLGVMGGPEAYGQLVNFIASRGKVDAPAEGSWQLVVGDGASRSLTVRLALLGLAAGSFEGPQVTAALLDGCWSVDPYVRDAAGYALYMETRRSGVVVAPRPERIPVVGGLAHRRFSIEEVLEVFAAVPEYAWDVKSLEDLAEPLGASLEERLAAHRADGEMDAARLREVMATLSVLDGAGRLAWLPFSDHLAPDDDEEGRALLAGIAAGHLDEVDGLLVRLASAPAAEREMAVLGALSVLRKMGGGAPPEGVVALLEPGEDEPVLLAAVETLGAFDSAESVGHLAELLGQSPWVVRLRVVEALAAMDVPEAGHLLSSIAAHDGSELVRAEAQKAAGGPSLLVP